MKDRIKSWKSTVIGLIALIGLAYKGYTSGGFEVSDFLILTGGIWGIGYKKIKKVSTVDPDREYPDERG